MRVVKKKICLLGEYAVGKTSLIRRFVEGTFDEKYLSTIGVNISRKSVAREDYRLELIIWDLAGGEEFSAINSTYVRGAVGGIVACDLTRPNTLENLAQYVQLIREVTPQAPVLVAANKSDLLEERRLTDQDLELFCKKQNLSWQITSAKSGDQVQELFQLLAAEIEVSYG